jgi:hypothetical protein
MAEEVEEMFVREVEVGVANLDASTDDGVVSTRVVVQRTTAADRKTGAEREFLLVYGAAEVAGVADALQKASERALADVP